MMTFLLLLTGLFWLLAGLVVYTYLGYGLLLWLLTRGRRGPVLSPIGPDTLPSVTMVVPAYNERAYLPAKLANCLAQTYPPDRVHLLFVVEGSTDGSAEYLTEQRLTLPNLTVIDGTERLGKVMAMNNAMRRVTTPITVFTDANTRLNPDALRWLVRGFEGTNVGCVTGEKRIDMTSEEGAAGSGEGLYWKYESWLKRMDARLHTIVGAAGELFAIRTDLYEPVEPDTLLDDFVISLRIAGRGFRVEYEPEAYALERPAYSILDEQKRKIRIAAGGFQAMQRLAYLWNIGRYGWLTVQYVSHRVLRWAVTPACLPLLLLINGWLAVLTVETTAGVWWAVLLLAQGIFYGMAALGYWLAHRQTRWKVTFVPFYFVFMNACVLAGFVRYCRGNLSGVWEKNRRAV
jgi:cellulose synthase/poly-beta-1,6-N-acetylglucosamine synthase-like glycosyltransferase